MNETESWSAPFSENPLLNAYFNALPKNVQEQLVQSGARVEGLRELRGLVRELGKPED